MNPTRTFQITLATAALLAGSACGSTTSNEGAAIDTPTVDPALAVETTTPPTTIVSPPATQPVTQPPTTLTALPPTTPASTAPATTTTTTTTNPPPEPAGEIDDLTVVPVSPDPTPVGPSDLAAPEHDTGCGAFGPIPDSAPIGYDGTLDILNDGTADDRLVSYLDGSWKLRSEIDGIVSEVVVDDVGPGSVKVLGLADIASIRGGDEIIATIGAEASNTKIGVFGHLEGGCLMQYRWADSTPAVFYVGGSITHGYSTWCGEGYIGINGYEQDDDGTYFGFGSAYEEQAVGQLGYMLNSDDYTEGMAYEDLAPVTFDCFGLTI